MPQAIATLLAPLVVLAPILFLVALIGRGDAAADAVKAVAVMYVVGTGVAGALLLAAGRHGRARSLEVGLIWTFAGAAAAAVVARPTTAHFGPNFTKDIVLGAFFGAVVSVVFAGVRRWFSPRAG